MFSPLKLTLNLCKNVLNHKITWDLGYGLGELNK